MKTLILLTVLATSLAQDIVFAPSSCLTKRGQECVFPFKYEGKTHYECTLSNSQTPWCAIEVHSDGEAVRNRWEDCDLQSNCDVEVDGACYDNSERLLEHQYNSNTMTPAECQRYCRGQGYAYAGVEYGNQCFCGNVPPPKPPSAKFRNKKECNSDCRGDSSKKCGGFFRINIYKAADESCAIDSDCYVDGKMCDGIADAGCICKNNQCKISSNCGIIGGIAGFRTECNTCGQDDCEDEGACTWTRIPGGGICEPVAPPGSCSIPGCRRSGLGAGGVCYCYDEDNSCSTWEDCHSNGKKCDGIQDAGCICKNNECKISSGCGTQGAFFFRSCDSCDVDDCLDEEACVITIRRSGEAPVCEPKAKPAPPGSCSIRGCSSAGLGAGGVCTCYDAPPGSCSISGCRNAGLGAGGVCNCYDDDYVDNSCSTWEDCNRDGKKCDGIQDVGCICKNNECKISSGCGTQGAFFFRSCYDCDADDCEDEGACRVIRGRTGTECGPLPGSPGQNNGECQEGYKIYPGDTDCCDSNFAAARCCHSPGAPEGPSGVLGLYCS